MFTAYGATLSQRSRHLPGVRLLREFHALEVLWAHSTSFDFYGHLLPEEDALKPTLPASLRELRPFGYSKLAPGLQGLVGSFVSGQFAHLRTIEIDEQGSWMAQVLRDVAVSFRSGGVDYKVHPHCSEVP